MGANTIIKKLVTPGRIPCGLTLAVSIFLVVAVCAADLISGSDIQLHTLYALPTSFFVFHCASRRLTACVLLFAGLAQLITLFIDDFQFRSFLVNAFIGLATMSATTWLAWHARKNYLGVESDAIRDPLTQLLNRRGFDEAMQKELARQRRIGTALSIAVIDLDGFKALNDLRGHAIGDDALKRTARVLLRSTRAIDFVSRLGGDEFAVLIVGAHADDSKHIAESLRIAIECAMQDAGYAVTASVGCKTFMSAPENACLALESVDRLMYAAKRSGKNGSAAAVSA